MVAEAIAKADSIGLAADGWSNIRNEPIVNFVVTTPTPFLYKVLPTGKSSHTAEFMAQETSRVINEIGQQKVFGLVTDNAANMKAAWKILEAKYPRTNLFTYGCLAHSLQLMFTDIKTLPTLKTFTANAKACIKAIKNSHKLNSAFIEKQSTTGLQISLKLPVKTRWGSLVSCFESLKENKQTIKAIAIDEGLSDALNKVPSLKKLMLSDDFWDKVSRFSSLLKPISDTIKIVESDTPQLSKVLSLYKKIEDSMEKILKDEVQNPLTKSEEKKVREILKHRKEFAVYDVHKIANLLDPRFKGCDLTPEEETIATEQIYNTAVKIADIDEDTVLTELANYIAKQGFFSKTFLWSSVTKITPIAWWAGLCKSTALSKLALKFLSLPTTSAACERTFSTYSDVHSKKRNRLTNDRASKIVYIAHNLRLKSEKTKEEHEEAPGIENMTVIQSVEEMDEDEETDENSDSDKTNESTETETESEDEE
ncbi:uncharacterized protein LOC124641447 [Helicoverpa zea]|uniref:uncharacterized protein LOC124641447 n=1 Tax=Helicoverpa zea TaxID=7113 RepID=UPI001F568836|nr:uncharacterized protein LOC124641447 [Helicoverpa zea]